TGVDCGGTVCGVCPTCTDGTQNGDETGVDCGGTVCSACPTGYSGSGETGCSDVDECATNNGGCDPLTACTNTVGSRTCGACPGGYSGDGATGCVDIDECATNNGGCGALRDCINSTGSSSCTACPNGTSDDGMGGCTINQSTRMFVTSGTYQANLGGVDGADARCQASATAASLPGTWRAWISDQLGNSPAANLLHYDHPYLRVDGQVIARSWTDLTDGTIRAPINITEDGMLATGQLLVTSGTNADGTMATVPFGQLCGNWTNTSHGEIGVAGGTNNVDVSWSNLGTYFCDREGFRLYCVEYSDPCETDNGGCDVLTTCTNTLAGAVCGACPSGYAGDGLMGCVDIDECAANACGALRDCTNSPGSFSCTPCPNGTSDDGMGGCTINQSTRVFVTSGTYQANLGGVAGADAICQSSAMAQGLGGSWSAWLSDQLGNSPSVNFTHHDHPYVRVDGQVVARSWTDLTSGGIRARIDVMENGAQATGQFLVTSGTNADGTMATVPFGQLCGNWTNTSSGEIGVAGGMTSVDVSWSNLGTYFCNREGFRLYCFED
ncbi:MAG: hypothetical protein KC668_17090, partial [Myxococcales bacterium]|nr:hypothetical protein [Myxococcales bacterium]